MSYYNSSIDSSPTRTKATLKAFLDANKRVVVIAGGKDKNSDYTGLGESILQVSNKIILCGQNSKLIKESIENAINTKNQENHGTEDIDFIKNNVFLYNVNTYEEAVQKARELADKDESVVLTPAGTSFDRFRNFEERGNTFKALINSLE